jgi:hypothetical protein
MSDAEHQHTWEPFGICSWRCACGETRISEAPPTADPDHDTLYCVCARCEKRFKLTAEDPYPERKPDTAYMEIRSCESGGVYGVTVACPFCEHQHSLL